MRIEQALFRPSLRYLSKGGQETEIMYGHGFDLPHFASFPLLDNPDAVSRPTEMYGAVLDVAARNGMGSCWLASIIAQAPIGRDCSV